MYILNLYEVLMKRMALSRALTLQPDEEKIKVTKMSYINLLWKL